MRYEYLTNEPLDRALSAYTQALGTLTRRTERVRVQDALGRITSEAVYAHICAPHYNASAMDGIALKASITFGATETTPLTLKEGDYVVVDTGDPLPKGCDAVVMVEDVVEEDGQKKLYAATAPWSNVRQIGEDICAGDMILTAHSEVTPAAMGAMLAGGVMELNVFARPLVGIIPTGDEIVLPCADPGEGDILEFNSTIFTGMLTKWGAQCKTYPIVKDKLALIEQAIEQALAECDLVIVNAGSSAGREDYTSTAIAHLGEVYVHGIAIKPGKPAILGKCKGKPVIGVPGYPVSGIIVLEQIIAPIVAQLCGGQMAQRQKVDAVLARRMNSSLKYEEFVRTRLGCVGGKMTAVPLNRGAGVVTSFVKADGIIRVPQDREGYEAGETVQVELLRPLEEILRMLVITGSHDPLIDEVANLMRLQHPDASVASSHVGSMGGIMAVKRGEAHMGGIHLLDEATGTYNESYVQKYFPQGGVALIECVQRQQGFMVAKGNPKGIRGWKEIAEQNLSYINRQKGSGTRLLCDYLVKQAGIDSSKIYGYEREEFTHTGVAALVAAGNGDAGLGIYSAAQLYGLDFVPVCLEQYDLLVSLDALELPPVQRFLEVLRSPELRKRLEALGGYTLEHPGRIRKRFE